MSATTVLTCRSVTIACYTTVELLLKDFAMDPDEGRMRKAAHLMVQSLAGSLALVTCKDPLRVSMTNNLRQLLVVRSRGHNCTYHTLVRDSAHRC